MATSGTEDTGGIVARAGAVGRTARHGPGGGVGTFFGTLTSAVGLVFVAVGAVSVDVSMEALGIVLGVVGYALGARTLGAVTVVLSTVMLIVVVVIGMGELPGLRPTDPLAL